MDASAKRESLLQRLAELDLTASADVVSRHRYSAQTLAPQLDEPDEATSAHYVCFGCGESLVGAEHLCSLLTTMYAHYVLLSDDERGRAEADAADVFARLRAMEQSRPRNPHDLREWFLRYARIWSDVPTPDRLAH